MKNYAIEGLYIASKIPKNLKVQIERAVDYGAYLNVSDFVRDAVKEKLTREGFLATISTTAEPQQQR